MHVAFMISYLHMHFLNLICHPARPYKTHRNTLRNSYKFEPKNLDFNKKFYQNYPNIKYNTHLKLGKKC